MSELRQRTSGTSSEKVHAIQPAEISEKTDAPPAKSTKGHIIDLIICVSGIYASFLTWAVLQERIATTPYGPDNKIFRASLVINTVQSFLAAAVGYAYLQYKQSRRAAKGLKKNTTVFDSMYTLKQLSLVALSQSLASPLSYTALKYVDYLTSILAKSCKLIPLMALQVTLYRRKFPAYKYAVVVLVTIGVSMFTIFHSAPKKASGASEHQLYGLGLLGISMLLDGLTNSTQDQIFRKNADITGPHVMCGLNLLTGVFTTVSLLTFSRPQLDTALAFIRVHPEILRDIVLFGLCGAVGQVFIFQTLEKFGSVVLVTVNVTRKMFSMLLSVVWFNHRLTLGQWAGVAAVFGGIGFEAWMKMKKN
ncbi:UDP-galactose transporter-like protein 1 [Yarrowia sp. B02]|nr:UDP-galactose transporter-like protein 1 [Yarrowia sp. B02]